MNKKHLITATAAIAMVTTASAWSQPVLRVVHEPRLVTTCSSKSEKDWAPCTWCGSKTSYERTYKWDVYNREWIETTKSVPELCRKCQSKQKSRDRLAREEASLDRKLEEKAARVRVAQKRQLLRDFNL